MYLIEEQESLDHFLNDIKNEECIAVDTEFTRVNTYYPKLCLLQIATPSLIACIDCLSEIDLNGLWEIIFDKKIEKVRNKLATETDVNTRVELESEQEGLFNQREFGCMERTNW